MYVWTSLTNFQKDQPTFQGDWLRYHSQSYQMQRLGLRRQELRPYFHQSLFWGYFSKSSFSAVVCSTAWLKFLQDIIFFKKGVFLHWNNLFKYLVNEGKVGYWPIAGQCITIGVVFLQKGFSQQLFWRERCLISWWQLDRVLGCSSYSFPVLSVWLIKIIVWRTNPLSVLLHE